MKNDRERQLFYYQREISFLREMGEIFSVQHPKIAKRLGLSKDHAADPHVERLIESFAFLTAYLQSDIDAQFPRISGALLDTLFPILTRPIPSMGIVEFALDEGKKMTQSYVLEKGSKVYTEGSEAGTTARFRTGAPVHFHPIKIESASIRSLRNYKTLDGLYRHTNGIVLSLKSLAGDFARMDLQHMRIFLNMPRNQALQFYSYLMRADAPLAYAVEKDNFTLYHHLRLRSVGLNHDDVILPCSDTHIGYALLQEYFVFPEKFFFIDVPIPPGLESDTIQVVLPMAISDSLSAFAFSEKNIKLHCAPIVNLFDKTTEPLVFDHKKLEYRLVPDRRYEKYMEIYSINDLYASRSLEEKERTIAPYFSYSAEHLRSDTAIFWYARRAATTQRFPGTNIFIALVDRQATPVAHAQDTVYARTVCTNRRMAADIQANTNFYSEKAVPSSSIQTLFELTEPMYPSQGGGTQWKLVSMLATSYLTFSDGDQGAERLRNLLRMLSEVTLVDNHEEIESIQRMEVQPCVRRFMRPKDWAGFHHGNAVTLYIDEHMVSADHMFLLLSLLDRFFATQAQMHTFSCLSVRSNVRSGVWHTWDQQSGQKTSI